MISFRSQPDPSTEGKTLVFHIGDHKAGSTSIQNAFATKRVHLDGHSIFYQATLNHNYLLKPSERKGQGQVIRPLEVAALASDVMSTQADISVVSAESFEGLKPGHFRKMLNKHFGKFAGEIRIVVYIRPHASRILSSYAERVKIGVFNKGLKVFSKRLEDNERFFYMKRLSAWKAEFGEQLIVRPLIRSELHNDDVLEDFIKVGLGDMTYRIDEAPQANESLSLEDLLIVRTVQDQLKDANKALRHAIGWEMARIMGGRARQGTKLQLPGGLAQEIAATYGEDAKALDAAFFDGRPLLQDELTNAVETARKAPQSMALKDHFSKSEIRNLRAMADMIASMTENEEGNWSSFFRKKRTEALHEVES